jgi:hypothetical protein
MSIETLHAMEVVDTEQQRTKMKPLILEDWEAYSPDHIIHRDPDVLMYEVVE